MCTENLIRIDEVTVLSLLKNLSGLGIDLPMEVATNDF
jgi:hypothetical protein